MCTIMVAQKDDWNRTRGVRGVSMVLREMSWLLGDLEDEVEVGGGKSHMKRIVRRLLHSSR